MLGSDKCLERLDSGQGLFLRPFWKVVIEVKLPQVYLRSMQCIHKIFLHIFLLFLQNLDHRSWTINLKLGLDGASQKSGSSRKSMISNCRRVPKRFYCFDNNKSFRWRAFESVKVAWNR